MKHIKWVFFIHVVSLTMAGFSFTSCTRLKNWWASRQEIPWHKSGMESALLEAQKTKRPLFVYWGAVWCPPCNVLKAKVFPEPEFRAAMVPFIPVYLDGDTESAQVWGEKLNASGYPTLMILDPAGKEVVRLSTSVSVAEIAEVMRDAYQVIHPVPELLSQIQAGSLKPGAEHWRLLGRYSWPQDAAFEDKRGEWGEALWKLKDQVPAELAVERARLGLVALYLKLDDSSGILPLNVIERSEILNWINQLLAKPELLPEVVGDLSTLGGALVKGLFDEVDREAKLKFAEKFKSVHQQIRQAPGLGWDFRLNTLNPAVDLASTDAALFALTEADKKSILEECEAALSGVGSKEQRVAVVSDVSYYLGEAGYKDRAKEVLQKELATGYNTYYTMSGLAYLANKVGAKDEALDWYEKAFRAADGRATRIQWGGKYLVYLIEQKPKEQQRIWQELKGFFTENLKMSDAFLGRNRKVLDKLKKAVVKWQKDTAIAPADLQKFATELQQHNCSAEQGQKPEAYVKACQEFFQGWQATAKN
ncbi:MAG: thioredoxin family protein [Bdellovibrionales bacterium]|nr:thioredoxin family protein [Bdellovibrionales bacterium]